MEEIPEIAHKPKYTLSWLGIKSLYVFGIAFVLAITAAIIDRFASGRVGNGLLQSDHYALLSESIAYCFGLVVITSMSLMLVEISFRKEINYLQYALIAMALTLFYLLLLAFSEKLVFAASYSIVSVMTIGLIALFTKGITHNLKAVWLTTGILTLEYGLIFILINLGSMALLVGSIILFLLIALAMYLTLKLKVENNELVIK